jgi:hypothetical protein
MKVHGNRLNRPISNPARPNPVILCSPGPTATGRPDCWVEMRLLYGILDALRSVAAIAGPGAIDRSVHARLPA